MWCKIIHKLGGNSLNGAILSFIKWLSQALLPQLAWGRWRSRPSLAITPPPPIENHSFSFGRRKLFCNVCVFLPSIRDYHKKRVFYQAHIWTMRSAPEASKWTPNKLQPLRSTPTYKRFSIPRTLRALNPRQRGKKDHSFWGPYSVDDDSYQLWTFAWQFYSHNCRVSKDGFFYKDDKDDLASVMSNTLPCGLVPCCGYLQACVIERDIIIS